MEGGPESGLTRYATTYTPRATLHFCHSPRVSVSESCVRSKSATILTCRPALTLRNDVRVVSDLLITGGGFLAERLSRYSRRVTMIGCISTRPSFFSLGPLAGIRESKQYPGLRSPEVYSMTCRLVGQWGAIIAPASPQAICSYTSMCIATAGLLWSLRSGSPHVHAWHPH